MQERAGKGGHLSVQYKYARGSSSGRVYSGLGFQACTKGTRAFCSAPFYVEDDLVNAFPTIMSQVFKQAGLKTPYLDDYVARREELFQELSTSDLDRGALKGLFLTSLHGGNYRYKAKGLVPFLEKFQHELRTCTEVLLRDPSYASLKAHVEQKPNPLGSAIALVSQCVESKIMAAKTSFTERFFRVATDLFDGHLREPGALDLEACSKFVEEKTGFKVMFVTKLGSDVWELPAKAPKSSLLSSGASISRPATRVFLCQPLLILCPRCQLSLLTLFSRLTPQSLLPRLASQPPQPSPLSFHLPHLPFLPLLFLLPSQSLLRRLFPQQFLNHMHWHWWMQVRCRLFVLSTMLSVLLPL